MLDVNFIVTCYNHEAWWPYLKELILSYKQITPHIALCYDGNKPDFSCDFRRKNRGPSRSPVQADGELIVGGFRKLKDNGVNRWIKLSVDSWLCREQVVVDLLMRMELNHYHYMGSKWYGRSNQYSTDIMFTDTMFMQRFTDFIAANPKRKNNLEYYAAWTAGRLGGAYMIPGRVFPPVRLAPALGWTMQHDLKNNVNFLNKYRLTAGGKNMKLVQNRMKYRNTIVSIRGLLDMLLELPESLRGTPMVEIGSAYGESTRIFSLLFSPVYSIDPLNNEKVIPGQKDVFTKTTSNRSIISIPKKSGDAVNDIPNEVSFIYIDGDHSYQAVKSDIANYLPKIRKDGYIGGHDYIVGGRKAAVGGTVIEVEKAVNEVLGLPDKVFIDNSWLKEVK